MFCIAVIGAANAKPVLHGSNWMAITGKPLAATAGAMIFQKTGMRLDAACAMLAAACTMWDTLSWGGNAGAHLQSKDEEGHCDQCDGLCADW